MAELERTLRLCRNQDYLYRGPSFFPICIHSISPASQLPLGSLDQSFKNYHGELVKKNFFFALLLSCRPTHDLTVQDITGYSLWESDNNQTAPLTKWWYLYLDVTLHSNVSWLQKVFLKHSLNFCISFVFDWQQLVDQHRSEDHALGGTGLGVIIRLSSTSLN